MSPERKKVAIERMKLSLPVGKAVMAVSFCAWAGIMLHRIDAHLVQTLTVTDGMIWEREAMAMNKDPAAPFTAPNIAEIHAQTFDREKQSFLK